MVIANIKQNLNCETFRVFSVNVSKKHVSIKSIFYVSNELSSFVKVEKLQKTIKVVDR